MIQASGSDSSLQALVALCGFCGLRIHEALRVRPSDIDVRERTLTVVGKGNKQRTVPISTRALLGLAAAMALAQPDDRTMVRMSNSSARAKISALGEKVGLSRHVASHDLRATFATETYNASRDLRAVQYLLGHSSIDTTTVYVEPQMKSMRGAVEALAAVSQ